MECPNCHSANPDTTRFCGECGTQLCKPDKDILPTKTITTPVKGFSSGKTVAGKYELIEELGRGGMGVVFKARDTKLKRTVALKFLAPELTRNKEAKERFIHEAQAASSLDHPNICTVHEVDETDDQMFIAMAYIEGQSLRDKIKKGPMKLDEALEAATQVAAGLHEAHEKGIVHRDIKSANIMLPEKGQAKIMDFGVAKLSGRTKFTQTGTTMGTISYMSPEQSQGEKVDHRTDIWSLGVVLYEMVTGQLPFKGEFEQAVVFSILNEAPEPLTALRTGVPMELERIVDKCMAKKPGDRYQHADDLMVDLRTLRNRLPDLLGSSQYSRPAVSRAKPRKASMSLLWKVAAAAAFLVAVIALWNQWRNKEPVSLSVSRFIVELPPGETVSGPGSAIALSRDGTLVVYAAKSGDTSRLYLRPIDELASHPIEGTEGAIAPFFSPDGKWVGFFTKEKIKKVSLLGGAPLTVCELESGFDYFGACWSEDGFIIYPDPLTLGLRRIPVVGGDPEPIVSALKDGIVYEGGMYLPYHIPDEKVILVTLSDTEAEGFRIGAYSYKTHEYVSLLEGSHACYTSSGHLIYVLGGNILAVPFDIKKLEISGAPVPVVEDVQTGDRGAAHFSISENGTFACVPGISNVPKLGLVWVDRSGEMTALDASLAGAHGQRLSPDGRSIVYKQKRNIWRYDLERKSTLRLSDGELGEFWPLWTPDGRRVIFNAQAGNDWDLYWSSAEGGEVELFVKTEYAPQPQTWSADGKELIFTQGPHPTNGVDIWVLPYEGDRTPRPLIQTRYNEFHPVISPDGRWLAYASDETGRFEVYVSPYPGLESKVRVSTDSGNEPLWSPDGKELFFRDITGRKMMAVSVVTEPELRFGDPVELFEGDYFLCSYWGRVYDITQDAQQFLMTSLKEQKLEPKNYQVVLNWLEELKQRVSLDD